ncbi:MAG: hypothetical protein K6E54_01905 [Bacteroidaceae bacterium]|nr:hypothetical protein [Bacteroidaceae bacterium]
MKRIFTLLLTALSAVSSMAQHSSAMTFVGKSNFFVSMGGQKMGETAVASDTVVYNGSDITFPSIKYNASVIPSFTIKNATFTGGREGVTWADQTFTSTVTVDGETKTYTGSSLTGTYTRENNIHKVSFTVTFTYGNMPMPITYNIEAYYVKAYTDCLDVSVGGIFNYSAETSVTYKVRTYVEDDVTKLDVEVPAYVLRNTAVKDLNVGSYTVKGLTYDESKGGYYRDYANDGVTMQFSSSGSIAAGEYALDGGENGTNVQDILVKLDESGVVTSIINNFKVGKMPFQIQSTFPGEMVPSNVESIDDCEDASSKVYDLRGQAVKQMKSGEIYIKNGRKFVAGK